MKRQHFGRVAEASRRDSRHRKSQAIDQENRTAGWEITLLKAAFIVLACLWIYSPTYHGDWHWDDDQLLTANPTVQHRISADPKVPPNSFRSLAKLWFNPDGADYFPLSYTALWAQWPFFGLQSTGYHITTILLHTVSGLLLWRLLALMKVPGPWLAAALFAVHPVCVESVAWISETKNTLSLALFLLAAIYWVRQDDEANPNQRTIFYGLSLLFFLLAMFAKTSVVAFPIVTLLYAWWKRGAVTKADLVRALPFILISIVLGVITISFQHGRAIGAERMPIGDLLSIRGFLSRTAIAGMGILFYLSTIVWPVNLLPIYPQWDVDPPQAWQLMAWLVIGGAAWWIWTNRGSWGRHVAFALGFFLLMVAPVLGFVTISYMRISWVADHFIYLPMIGVIALLVAAAMTWFEGRGELERPVLLSATALLLGTLAGSSFIYAMAWVDEDHLWEHTLKHNFDAWQAHNRLGVRKSNRGDLEGAHFHYQNAVRLRPDLGETHNNLGSSHFHRAQLLSKQGNEAAAAAELAVAIERFAEASRLTPSVLSMRTNLGNALFTAGRFQDAADVFQALLDEAPNDAAAMNNYAVALYKQGKTDEAIKQFRRALEIAPDLKDARSNLAQALGETPAAPPEQAPKGDQPLFVSPTLSAEPPR